ncbi:MAG: DUF2202 domain-containing protein [Ardenticatenaceae bacterium]|nr:DUF2202 domain-containing protein [Ardenticatenaceae bacterium]
MTANNAVAAPAVNNSTGNNVAAAANTAVSTAPEPATDVASTANSTEDTTADTTNDTLNTTNQTAAAPATTTTGTLTEDEIDSLTFMREEEKLAHDVYVTLYDMWGSQVFINIAASEQTHTDTILGLLELYNLPDPAVGNDIGVFTNTTLQNLYDQLISQGSQSLLEALRVGAAIEEIDIIDLENRLATTTNYDITTAYQNLLSGSENHLRSFVSTIERQVGEVYTPQYLSQEAYDAILSGQTGQNGNGQSGDSGNGQQGSNGQGGQGQASTGQSTGGGKGYRGGRGNGNTTP